MSSAAPRLSVLVADDSPFGAALAAALDHAPDLACAGRATSLVDTLGLALARRPDVVLIGSLVRGASSLAAVAELAAVLPDTRVLVLADFASDLLAHESKRRGAAGFLVHNRDVATLLGRVRACAGLAPPEPALC